MREKGRKNMWKTMEEGKEGIKIKVSMKVWRKGLKE